MSAEEKIGLASLLSENYVRASFDETWKRIAEEISKNYSSIVEALQ
jgi:hypothetical protein